MTEQWTECDNVKALEMKMKGCEVEFREVDVGEEWMEQRTYNYRPSDKYRYREKPEFKEGEMILKWWTDDVFEVNVFEKQYPDDQFTPNKIIPYQAETVEIERPKNGSGDMDAEVKILPALNKLLSPGEKAKFLIMKLPDGADDK